MTRDYGRQAVGKKSRAPRQFLSLVLCFLLGFLTASLCKMDGLNRWLNTQIQAFQEAKPRAPKPLARQIRQSPKPKFEFYTLLANEEGKVDRAPKKYTEPLETKTKNLSEVAPNGRDAGNNKADFPKYSQQIAKVAEADLRNKAASLPKDKGSYLVQVASFKNKKDAEQMKALLTLKGYDVRVMGVSNANGNWFRVLIGPYANRVLAQKAQTILSKSERLHGMVRSVGGG